MAKVFIKPDSLLIVIPPDELLSSSFSIFGQTNNGGSFVRQMVEQKLPQKYQEFRERCSCARIAFCAGSFEVEYFLKSIEEAKVMIGEK